MAPAVGYKQSDRSTSPNKVLDMRINARALFTLIPATLIAPMTFRAPAVAPVDDGYVIAMKITSDAMQNENMGLTLKVAGAKMRVEMDMSAMMGGRAGGEMADGAYMLLQENGKVAMILPNMRNPMSGSNGFGMSMDLSAILSGGPGRGSMPEASNIQVDVAELGAGEAILGHPTRKYRITTKATVNGSATETVTESWFATDLAGAEDGFKKFTQSFGAQFSGASAKGIQDAMAAKMPKGFPLRSITTATESGKTQKITMEVTQVGKATFEASAFEVPAGIQLMDMSGMMGGRGR